MFSNFTQIIMQRQEILKLRQDPLEAILVIFGCSFLNFFLKVLEKYEKWHHFCAHAQ